MRFLLLLSMTICIEGYRSFDVVLTKAECENFSEFVIEKQCEINEFGGFDYEFETLTLVKEVALDLKANVDRSGGKPIEIFNMKNMNWCQMVANKSKMNLVRIFLKLLRETTNSDLQCPFQPETFKISNITLDADHIPPYTPDANFLLNFTFYNGTIKMLNVNIFGKIVTKRSSKKNLMIPI